MNIFKKLFRTTYRVPQSKPNYDILFLPLNGIFIDKIYPYKDLCIYPLDTYKTKLFKSGNKNIIFEHVFLEHPALKEYNIVCYGKDDKSTDNEFFTIEAAGDERLLMNPVLTLKFLNPPTDLYHRITNISHIIYAIIRWLQYRCAGENLTFDFNFLPIRSSAFSFLDGGEHKVLMPGRFAFLSTQTEFLDNGLSFFYNTIQTCITSVINSQETNLNQLLYFYNEIWELILKDDYHLLIVKTLGFLSNYYNIKKFSQLPYIISNIKLPNFDKTASTEIIHNLDAKRKNFLHENKFTAKRFFLYSIQNCKDIFNENLMNIKFILELFDSLIYEEVLNAQD